jgi:hypothetical protein
MEGNAKLELAVSENNDVTWSPTKFMALGENLLLRPCSTKE